MAMELGAQNYKTIHWTMGAPIKGHALPILKTEPEVKNKKVGCRKRPGKKKSIFS